jgi:hypothetical protein
VKSNSKLFNESDPRASIVRYMSHRVA